MSVNDALREAATTILEVTQREGDDGTGGWQTICDLAGAAAVVLEQAAALAPDPEAHELAEFAEQVARFVRG